MKKDFGVQPYLFPMPVYMIGTYNEDGSVDEMAMAWGGICAEDMVALNLEAEHKTVANLKARGAFTLAVPGVDTIKECDYLGTASGVKFRTSLRSLACMRLRARVWTRPSWRNFRSRSNAPWKRWRTSLTVCACWGRS